MTRSADTIARFLESSPVIILDGALATELERRGADLDDPLWSAKILLERPQLIRDVHRDYLAAGADVATTASYQASMEGFARHGIDAPGAAAFMRESVALACAARDDFWAVESNRIGRRRPLVAASMGPYGAMLANGSEYRGGYAANDEALARHHRPRLAALAGSGADLLAFETLPSLREALVLAHLLREFPGTPAWISFSCRDGLHTSEGDDIGECAARLRGFAQVEALGINCTAPRHVASLLGRMHGADKPLLAYPNSGEYYDAGARRWRGSGGFAADDAQEWYDAGARLIGGCCRTTPDDIRALRSWAGTLGRRD